VVLDCSSRAAQTRKAAGRFFLYALPDGDLRDIGISWAEIEYLALNGTDERVDPPRHR
jgi:hypothetical protein